MMPFRNSAMPIVFSPRQRRDEGAPSRLRDGGDEGHPVTPSSASGMARGVREAPHLPQLLRNWVPFLSPLARGEDNARWRWPNSESPLGAAVAAWP